ncbi:hypothetical protein UA08_03205 [Talaromyces atroroseus]|uniref:Activator of Hsp90 ATPase N-terminal domain-containing protein n=1 Tax=Talaromyces atroroseus TaxID=1441469 RepID=A0A225AHF6_TALAT|nr:hypothetical protein UA08_03205 [Talaromyces atroroseus]OKL60851.1 hypothetical protein UA08_03205 [Talaromyces atroroseus]
MFGPVTISTQIEISASPATVRSAFLDFARVKKCTGWSIGVKGSNQQPAELTKGDRLRVDLGGLAFSPNVLHNEPELFIWDGNIPGIISGKHHFYFSPSETNPGGTTFIQKEDFTGILTLFWPRASTKAWSNEKWNAFNEALKKEVEQS